MLTGLLQETNGVAAFQPKQRRNTNEENDCIEEQCEGRAEQTGDYYAQSPADDSTAVAGANNSAQLAITGAKMQDGQQGQKGKLQREHTTGRQSGGDAQPRQENQHAKAGNANCNQQAAPSERASKCLGPGARDRRV